MVLDPRNRVLDAADRLFNERGIRPVGMDDIRDASGVSLKRLYGLFASKEELAQAVLRRRDAVFRRSLADYVAPHGSPRARILAVFDSLAEWFGEPDFRGCPFINAFGEMSATSDGIAGVVRAQKLGLRELFAELVEQAGGTPEVADQLALCANGAMVTAAVFDAPDVAAQAKSAAAALLDRAGI